LYTEQKTLAITYWITDDDQHLLRSRIS